MAKKKPGKKKPGKKRPSRKELMASPFMQGDFPELSHPEFKSLMQAAMAAGLDLNKLAELMVSDDPLSDIGNLNSADEDPSHFRRTRPRTPKQKKADALFQKAIDEPNERRRRKLLDDVLKQDPEHIEAMVETAMMLDSTAERIEKLQQAVNIGEASLSEELKNEVGQFWILDETRPYMQAREQLAICLIEDGRPEEAVLLMEDMLRLNPNDDQGIRWVLLESFCRLNWLEKAEALLDQYPDDAMPFFAMTRICLQFQKSGDTPELRELLREQIDQNPHIVPRLIGKQEVPPYEISSFIAGTEDEANDYCQRFRSLWRATPGAMTWLNSMAREMTPPAPVPTKKEMQQRAAQKKRSVKKLPVGQETWFCDIDLLADDLEAGVPGEVDWSDHSHTNWLISIIDQDTNAAIRINPGDGPLCQESVLSELFTAMLEPGIGDARRPETIRFIDAELCMAVGTHLAPLGITTEVADELPEILEYLRKQRIAIQPEELPLDEILNCPVDDGAWEIDWRLLETWIPDAITSEPTQPWMILVANSSDGTIRGQQVCMSAPSQELVAHVLGQAILSPLIGDPCRPEVLKVRQISQRLLLAGTAKSIEASIVVETCEVLDGLYKAFHEGAGGEGPRMGAMIDQPDVTPEMINDFFEASADYYKSRIYTRVRPETLVEVSCPDVLPGKWTAVTMGQMGQEIGLMLFDDPKKVKAMFERADEDPSVGMLKIKGIGYSVDGQEFLHPADVAAAEQFGWPVPSPDAWPSAYYIADGKPRELTAQEIRFLTVGIRAALEVLGKSQNSIDREIPLHDGSVRVLAKLRSVQE